MASTTDPSEVLVIGGGPAGCAAATLLARWGHRVTLIAKPAATTVDLGESIPPSTRKLFDVLGVRDAIDAAPFIRATGNTVWWGNELPRVEWFANRELGWQVSSAALAAILLDHARQSGVKTEWARAETSGVARDAARFVLDCTGRAGLMARSRGLRVYDARYRTIAVVGLWQSDRPFPVPDPTHTLIESYDGGWAWSVPRSADLRFVAVMVDPRTADATSAGASGLKPGLARYLEQLHRTRHLGRMLAGANLVGEPTGWDASMYHATRYVDDHVLLVGDAASFLDPLSSAGIKKALASGWLAAVAVHTALLRPAMRDVAFAFFAAREAEVAASFRAMTERFFADAAASHPHPFWQDRRDEPAASERRPGLDAAFARLRQAPHLRVARGRCVRVEPRPAVRGHEIALEPRLVVGAHDPGIRHAFGVDLLTVLELAPGCSSVPEVFAAYNRRHPPVELPAFLGALATLLAQNWLEWL